MGHWYKNGCLRFVYSNQGKFEDGPPLVEELATASSDPFDGKMSYVLDPDLDCMVSSNAGDGTGFDAAKRNLDPEEFALEQGLYDPKDGPFSFSDVFCPVDFGGARYCEARARAPVRFLPPPLPRAIQARQVPVAGTRVEHILEGRSP